MVTSSKVAVITGGGSGIGRACSIALLREGYDVAVADLRLDGAQETIAMAGDSGGRGLAVETDVSDPTAVENLFATILKEFGRLDVLFNNAGRNVPGVPFAELTDEQWDSVLDVNLKGTFLCARAAFRIMKDQIPMGGRIINNGSIAAQAPRPGAVPYTTSKNGIIGLTKAISIDGRPYDVACSQIDIGNAATPFTERLRKPEVQSDGAAVQEPLMDVEHVAEAIVYMANLPLTANVLFMTLMATKMPFLGRG